MHGSVQRREEKGQKVYISEQKKVNERFGRKMNKDVNANRKLFGRR